MIGSKQGEVTAPFIKCGIGMPEDFPTDVRGKIALIQRGGVNYTFAEKVQAARTAGAIGAILYNDERPDNFPWTLIRPDCGYPDGCHSFELDVKFDYPVTVALSKADGEKLVALAGTGRAITIGVYTEDYGKLSGTSMATPHVAGVAALLWSISPLSSAVDVRNAISLTAHDVGQEGHDIQSGFGLADAYEAARFLAPANFGINTIPNPLPIPPKRRSGPH
jgi:serine protease